MTITSLERYLTLLAAGSEWRNCKFMTSAHMKWNYRAIVFLFPFMLLSYSSSPVR